jgi:hypothetical protein
MLAWADILNPDLDVPDEITIGFLFGGKDNAFTNPVTKNITLSSYYLKKLDRNSLRSLYKQ